MISILLEIMLLRGRGVLLQYDRVNFALLQLKTELGIRTIGISSSKHVPVVIDTQISIPASDLCTIVNQTTTYPE